MTFDSRLTPARPDLAAKFLEGQVEAERFVEGEICEVVDAIVPLRREPVPDAPLDTEGLKGERVSVYDINEEGWCWGQLQSDGYVGWLPAISLMRPGPETTHKVAVLRDRQKVAELPNDDSLTMDRLVGTIASGAAT